VSQPTLGADVEGTGPIRTQLGTCRRMGALGALDLLGTRWEKGRREAMKEPEAELGGVGETEVGWPRAVITLLQQPTYCVVTWGARVSTSTTSSIGKLVPNQPKAARGPG
jgi:hypothetical protein